MSHICIIYTQWLVWHERIDLYVLANQRRLGIQRRSLKETGAKTERFRQSNPKSKYKPDNEQDMSPLIDAIFSLIC